MEKEYFNIVDKYGNIIGIAARSECHTNPELIHRAVHVLVFNSNHQLYLQKRAINKDIQPGKWDTSVGGHVGLNEDYEEAAYREMAEELNIHNVTLTYLYDYIWETTCETELVRTFKVVYDGEIVYNTHEIEDGRFWDMKEIEEALGKNIFTPNFEIEYKKYKELSYDQSSNI
jgi:isopentenyl-diphosphate delta-isomerase type 1